MCRLTQRRLPIRPEVRGNKLVDEVAKANAHLHLLEERAYVTGRKAEPVDLQRFKQLQNQSPKQ